MISIFTFVTVTKGTYPFNARDFFVSTCFGSKLMSTRMMPSRKVLPRSSVEKPLRVMGTELPAIRHLKSCWYLEVFKFRACSTNGADMLTNVRRLIFFRLPVKSEKGEVSGPNLLTDSPSF